MRALVFGNSHTACLIEAWREVGTRPGLSLEFFVQSGGGVADYTMEGTKISANEGLKSLLNRLAMPVVQDMDGYDALVIVGSQVSLFHVVLVLNHYRILGWPMSQNPEMPTLTETVLRLAVRDALRASNAGQLMAALRGIPALATKPIMLLPQPFVSERALTGKKQGEGFRRLNREGIGYLAATVFTEEVARMAADFSAIFYPQPAATIVRGCLTAEEFTNNARRLVNLKLLQPEEDILHANIAYGRLMLRQIFG